MTFQSEYGRNEKFHYANIDMTLLVANVLYKTQLTPIRVSVYHLLSYSRGLIKVQVYVNWMPNEWTNTKNTLHISLYLVGGYEKNIWCTYNIISNFFLLTVVFAYYSRYVLCIYDTNSATITHCPILWDYVHVDISMRKEILNTGVDHKNKIKCFITF